jgi:hypothetical protein
MQSALELQKAVFAALAGDPALVARLGAGKIHDHAPARLACPYVTFGRFTLSDHSTATESGEQHLMTLHVWSEAGGKREVFEIADLVRRVLDDRSLAVTGQHLALIRFETMEVRFDASASVHHGALRFRAVTEPVIQT